MKLKKFCWIFPLMMLLCLSMEAKQTKNRTWMAEINELTAEDFFKSSQIGISVYDITAKKDIYELNSKHLCNPASNMKILTTSTALFFLGPDYNFVTSVKYTGEIKDSVLWGDLYVKGGCDPDFTSQDLKNLSSAVKAYGVKEIRGNIFGDCSMLDSLYWGSGWMWDDNPSTDLPYLTPLCINKNSIILKVSPGKIGNPLEVQTIPQTGFFNVLNSSRTDSTGNGRLIIDRDWINCNNNLIVKGSLPADAVPAFADMNLVHPEEYFLYLFRESLNSSGIRVPLKTSVAVCPKEAKEISRLSRPYSKVLPNLNKMSDNLSAEMSLRAISASYFPLPAGAEKGIKMVDSLISLAGLNPKNYKIVDGSGLSKYDLISPELLTGVLKFMRKQPQYEKLYWSFPIAGVDGTLKNRMKGSVAEGNVHAKTGSLSGTSSLSGYLRTAEGHELAFSIIMSNYVSSAQKPREYQDKICNILCSIKQGEPDGSL